MMREELLFVVGVHPSCGAFPLAVGGVDWLSYGPDLTFCETWNHVCPQ